MSKATVISDLPAEYKIFVCTGGSHSKGSGKAHLTDEKWCTDGAETETVRAGTLYGDQEICEVCLDAVDLDLADDADRLNTDNRDTIVPDGGCRYTKHTGPGYEGTYVVGSTSTEINLVSVGIDRGTRVVSVADRRNETAAVRIQFPEHVDEGAEVLHRAAINGDGFYTISKDATDHLGVDPGDDIRLYADGEDWVVIAADSDPLVAEEIATDGSGITTEFCASCMARVAREDRVTVDERIYHRQCAPDTSAYDTEVPR